MYIRNILCVYWASNLDVPPLACNPRETSDLFSRIVVMKRLVNV